MSAVAKSKTKRPVNPPINARPNERSSGNDNRFAEAAARLTEIGRDFYARGWVLGTSGNFSGVTSREPLLHIAIARGVDAGAVLHTHSVFSTVLSGSHSAQGGIALEGFEMLKGLEGVRTHKHREWLPILENSQDMIELGERVSKTLRESPGIHGFLLKEHGLYTWGAGLQEAKRHVEILEFLMEVLVRSDAARSA